MFEPSIERLEAEVSALVAKESAMLARKQAALDAVRIAEESAGALYLDEPEQAIAGIDAAVTRANSEGKAVDAALVVLRRKRVELLAKLHERRCDALRSGRDGKGTEVEIAEREVSESRAKFIAAEERLGVLRAELERAETALMSELKPTRMDPHRGLVLDSPDCGVLQASSVDVLVAEAAKVVAKRAVPAEAAIRMWASAVENAVAKDRPQLLRGTNEAVDDPAALKPVPWDDVPRSAWVEPNVSPARLIAFVEFARRYTVRFAAGKIDESTSQLEFPGASLRSNQTAGLGDPIYTVAGCVSRSDAQWK
jgi:hypothetical protein